MRRQGLLVPFGECKRDEEERDADSVVQAALDVEPLPDPRRDPIVGDDRLAERRVGAGKHDREHERLDQADARQHADPGERSERRSSAAGRSPAAGPVPRTHCRRAGSEIREASAKRTSVSVASASSLTDSRADAQIDQPEDRSGQQPRGREEDRRCDERPLEPAGDGRERKQHQRNGREFPSPQLP